MNKNEFKRLKTGQFALIANKEKFIFLIKKQENNIIFWDPSICDSNCNFLSAECIEGAMENTNQISWGDGKYLPNIDNFKMHLIDDDNLETIINALKENEK